MRSLFLVIISIGFIGLSQGCLEVNNPYTEVAPGTWRGVMDLRDPAALPPLPEHTDQHTEFDLSPTPEGTLPFNFEITYLSKDSMRIVFKNGADRIPVNRYTFLPNASGEKDRIIIYFPIYDTKLIALVHGGIMEGEWQVDFKDKYKIPFRAHLGEAFRFTNSPDKPQEDISGRWEVTFSPDSEDEGRAIGQFAQTGNKLTGTFATPTGDYRFLEGTVSGKDIRLSTFDGSQAYLFEAKIISPDSLSGAFFSGTHYKTTWEARRNEEFILEDAETITPFTSDTPYELKARSLQGESIDFTEGEFRGNIKLVEIMGSWCPNCHDELKFLKEWKSQNPDLPVQIVSVAFERYDDDQRSLAILETYIRDKAVPWPVIYGGSTREATESIYLEPLESLNAYPTLIFIDKENLVRQVHTGFYGPATTEYEAFQKKFDTKIRELLNE